MCDTISKVIRIDTLSGSEMESYPSRRSSIRERENSPEEIERHERHQHKAKLKKNRVHMEIERPRPSYQNPPHWGLVRVLNLNQPVDQGDSDISN
jgi:hypothetical protein